ncbi:MAG: 30S ribosomal protein S13 [Deferribacterota bacterium]|nr:30S ribosomal protein S13 [Deferribacterota bacterium]
MARIAGVDIPNNKRVEVGLTYIYGIGRATSSKLLDDVSIDKNKKIGELTEQEISSIRKYIDNNLVVEGELRREVTSNIKRLIEINCYRGLRHKNHMPCRGQRTKSNARTARGLAGKGGIKRK